MLTGTLFAGLQIDLCSFWLILEAFADGKASVATARETQVNRHTSDRLFRLLRAALYLTRSEEPIILKPEDVGEFDEVYITAGLKGNAGGLALEREPRKRGLKRRGRDICLRKTCPRFWCSLMRLSRWVFLSQWLKSLKGTVKKVTKRHSLTKKAKRCKIDGT